MTEITGVQPASCPWSAYEDPVVQAACILRNRIDKQCVLIDTQLSVAVEAYELMQGITNHIEIIDLKEEQSQRELERLAAEQNR